MEDMAGAGLAFFRITVVGMDNSGKTCLVNSFVNNYCPTVYTPTDDPTLYYKTVRLPAEDDDAKPFSVLVEIEDTYSSFRGDGKDLYGRTRDVRNFIDMTRRDTVKLGKKGQKVSCPLSVYEPPRVGKYQPLTKGRMGFMIVFDANDEKSYTEALNVHLMLDEDLRKKKIRLKPVIYLVANKIDKEENGEEMAKIVTSAEIYSQHKMIRFWQVSALEFKRVKKMFREMLNAIRSNQILWLMDESEDGGGGEDTTEDQSAKCALQ